MKTKKVKLNLDALLDGPSGNAHFLMGAFRRVAKREGWAEMEIDAVLTECKAGDYDHLLQMLRKYTK